jgi:8-oxo-dGTP diphosphatase
MPYTYKYPRAALTVDCVLFGYDGGALQLLLIERDFEPFAGTWALPGGFVNLNETLDTAALRELQEETSVTEVYLEQLYTFSGIHRDPRERVISVAYYALVKLTDHKPAAASDARNAAWFKIGKLPKLAFDHDTIIATAIQRLKNKVRYEPIGFELLPKAFTLTQLQRLYETILDTPIDKRNFRKKLLAMNLVIETGGMQQDAAHRPARLYRFDETKYQQLKLKGFNFEL